MKRWETQRSSGGNAQHRLPPRPPTSAGVNGSGRRSAAAVMGKRYIKGEQYRSRSPPPPQSAKISRSLDNLLNTVSCYLAPLSTTCPVSLFRLRCRPSRCLQSLMPCTCTAPPFPPVSFAVWGIAIKFALIFQFRTRPGGTIPAPIGWDSRGADSTTATARWTNSSRPRTVW